MVPFVSEACQINDLDHPLTAQQRELEVSEACQINDLDHGLQCRECVDVVSEACQINDLDHANRLPNACASGFRSLSDQ